SCKAVSDQRLDGAIKSDIWEWRGAPGRERFWVRRAEAHETHFPFLGLPALERLLWIGGKVAGEDGKLLVAIEGAPADGLSGKGIADNAGKYLAVTPSLGLAGRTHRGKRQHFQVGAGEFRACHRSAGELGEDRLESVMALVVKVIGLGSGKHDAVDPRSKQTGPQSVRAGPEAFEDLSHGAFEIDDRLLAPVQRGKHIDKHDLPVEPRKVVTKKGSHNVAFIGLVAPLHHREQRAARKNFLILHVKRRERQCRRASKIAWHEKSSRRKRRERMWIGAHFAKISLEQI